MNTQIRNMWTVPFKQKIKDLPELPFDTTAIQYNSLVSFMKELGYEPVRMYCGFRKFDKSKTLYAPNFLSFKHAQYLHNGVMFRVCGSLFDSMGLPYTFQVDIEVWEKAKKAKYCKETYLIKLKKYPFIKANKHWISLQNDSEWDNMFNEDISVKDTDVKEDNDDPISLLEEILGNMENDGSVHFSKDLFTRSKTIITMFRGE